MKKRSYWKIVISVLVLVMMFTGCGASYDSMENMSTSASGTVQDSMEYGYDSVVVEETADYDSTEQTQSESKADNNALNERKLIKNVNMTVETKEFDAFLNTLETKVDELEGYIESLETYNGSVYSDYRDNNSRNASMTIRVPQNKLDGFLSEMSGICNVIRRSENVTDVTLTYVDLESHKKALVEEQERLLDLIAQAEYIDEIITIESRLSEVRYRIESMESQLRTFDNKINYSTIELYIEEVKELTPVVEETALQRIGNGFMKNVTDILHGLKELGIWLVISIPYFILLAIMVLIVIMLIKVMTKISQKNAKNKIPVPPLQPTVPSQPTAPQEERKK